MKFELVLEQPGRGLGCVGSLSLWRSAHFEIACATFSALSACQIALILKSLMQPSRHFGRVSDHSRCGTDSVKESLRRDPDKISCREPVQRSCQETSCKDLVQRPCKKNRDLAKKICYIANLKDLL